MTTNTGREARLAAQLRANLKRRKEQARGGAPVEPEAELEAGPDIKR